jgi:hypothetical protein
MQEMAIMAFPDSKIFLPTGLGCGRRPTIYSSCSVFFNLKFYTILGSLVYHSVMLPQRLKLVIKLSFLAKIR